MLPARFWRRYFLFSALLAVAMAATCVIEWRMMGRSFDGRPILFTVVAPFLAAVCGRGIRSARTDAGVNWWTAALLIPAAGAALLLLTRR